MNVAQNDDSFKRITADKRKAEILAVAGEPETIDKNYKKLKNSMMYKIFSKIILRQCTRRIIFSVYRQRMITIFLRAL